jgi:hypothetical protein
MILDLFSKEIEFDNIHGYVDIKDRVRHDLDSNEDYNLLFDLPTSAKTSFLLGIITIEQSYTVTTNLTK